MAIKKSRDTSFEIQGTLDSALELCSEALSKSSFSSITINQQTYQIKATYHKATVWGDIEIRLVQKSQEFVQVNTHTTAAVDNIYALFSSPLDKIQNAFKNGLGMGDGIGGPSNVQQANCSSSVSQIQPEALPPFRKCAGCGAELPPGEAVCPYCGASAPVESPHIPIATLASPSGQAQQSGMGGPPKSKTTYLLLGIFLGGFGIHNFYAGYTAKAVIQLLITLLSGFAFAWVSGIWAIVEICTIKQDAKGISFV